MDYGILHDMANITYYSNTNLVEPKQLDKLDISELTAGKLISTRYLLIQSQQWKHQKNL